MSEKFTLHRFEYVLTKDYFVVHKQSAGFKYKLKHVRKEFDSEEKVQQFIEDTLKERKRYLQLLKTLSITELKVLFSDVVLLGLSPKQIGEYETVEQFEYLLVVDEDWVNVEKFKSLDEVKDCVADRIGLNFHGYLNLIATDNTVVVDVH